MPSDQVSKFILLTCERSVIISHEYSDKYPQYSIVNQNWTSAGIEPTTLRLSSYSANWLCFLSDFTLPCLCSSPNFVPIQERKKERQKERKKERQKHYFYSVQEARPKSVRVERCFHKDKSDKWTGIKHKEIKLPPSLFFVLFITCLSFPFNDDYSNRKVVKILSQMNLTL